MASNYNLVCVLYTFLAKKTPTKLHIQTCMMSCKHPSIFCYPYELPILTLSLHWTGTLKNPTKCLSPEMNGDVSKQVKLLFTNNLNTMQMAEQ